MKYVLLVIAFSSLSAFASPTGQGAKPGCNPSEWSCDSACQERKARACGLTISTERVVVDKSRATASGGRKGKKNVGRQ